MVYDACPVHACLPYVAERIAALTPDAKIIVMVGGFLCLRACVGVADVRAGCEGIVAV
jgi:hypothetical protein